MNGFLKKVWPVMWAFVCRDWRVYRPRLVWYITLYGLWYPFMYGTCFGYLLPLIGFGDPTQIGSFLVGTILFCYGATSFALYSDFLFDFERDRHVTYQLSVLSPVFILVERWLLHACMLFLVTGWYVPFIFALFHRGPIAGSWWHGMVVVAVSSAFVSSFQLFSACYGQGLSTVRTFWRRVNYPLVMLGGMLVPWWGITKFSKTLGYVVLANPFMQVTEGLRNALLADTRFVEWRVCSIVLSLYSMLFVVAAVFYFKKKMDSVS